MPRLSPALLHKITLLLALLIPIAAASTAAQAQSTLQDRLMRALAQAKGGERIALPGGNYGALLLVDGRKKMDFSFPSTVTITSANPARPAVFSGLDLRGVTNLTFENVVFDYTFQRGHRLNSRPFVFRQTRGITLRRVRVDGDLARGVSAAEDGRGWAHALSFQGGRDITVEHSEIVNFYKGLAIGGADNVVVRGNRVHGMRMDGMTFVALQNAVIEGNHIHDFNRTTLKADHADMIQFWTAGSTRPSRNVRIRYNLLDVGGGDATHSIFMRNEMVDTGRAGAELFYRDIVIEENVIINARSHGLSVGEANGLVVRNNTLVRAPRYARGKARDSRLMIPRINLAEESRRVTLTGNMAAQMPGPRAGWTVANNILIQDISPMQPGYYVTLFANPRPGNPHDLSRFFYRPGKVPLGVGARRLRGG